MEKCQRGLRLIDCVELRGVTRVLKGEPAEKHKEIEAMIQRGTIAPMRYLLYDLQRINSAYKSINPLYM
ncbi:hypothetical protein GW924_00575 [Candidatus Pacearchaeota archaeon]|nr:hypothetical protein [Candidatus Pacearchaeota archaeon]